MGISCATRGNIYLLLFGIVPLILSKGFWDKKRLFALSAIVILFGAIFFAQTPFIVYNTIKCGKLSGASTASAAVLALGNTPEAPAGGRNYFAGNGPMEYPESYQIFMARDKERSVPLQIMDYFFENPLEYIELSFRKVLLFWTWAEIPNNVSYYEGLKQSRCLFFNVLGHSYIIILLGISGILFSLKNIFKERNYPLIMLLAVVIFYQLSIAFFYNLGRFRAPILADMAVFSSIFIVAVAENFKNRAMKKYLIGSLTGGAYLIFGYSIYQRYYESTIMEYVRPNGTEIATLNKGEKCIFDYGPISFGNWMGFSFKCGDTVTKEFKVKNPNQAGKLKFMLTNEERKGTALIKINGTPHTFELDKSADGYYIVPVTLQEGKVKLELISVYGSNSNKEVDLSMDGQRFYKRSWYNDEVIPFEWVMRFYYADKE